jgi:hypothetical protein
MIAITAARGQTARSGYRDYDKDGLLRERFARSPSAARWRTAPSLTQPHIFVPAALQAFLSTTSVTVRAEF